MLTCVLMWLGRRVAASTICLTLDLALDPVLLLFSPQLALLAAILNLSVTTTPILPFGACYVIMHKVYYKLSRAVTLLILVFFLITVVRSN